MHNDQTVSSDLTGRLRNTILKPSQGLMPLYEAVVNSIHSLDDSAFEEQEPEIIISIQRHNQTKELKLEGTKKGPDKNPYIKNIAIKDNGIGFNDQNWSSFNTLDSQFKIARGCRGVGRLLWLKAFKYVRIESTFDLNEKKGLRVIHFSPEKGFSLEVNDTCESESRSTKVELCDFFTEFGKKVVKTTKSIADSMLDHCLWYFLREGGAPYIQINDENESISLNDLYEVKIGNEVDRQSITIKGVSFDLIHLKFRTSGHEHKISYCAENRLVKEEKISGKINGLHGVLSDPEGDFAYSCYVSSPFLDDSVRPERDDFVITSDNEDLLDEVEITIDDIRKGVLESIEVYLSDYLKENKKLSEERLHNFVKDAAPKYRTIIKHLEPNVAQNIDPQIKDKDLDVMLHKKKYDIEKEALKEGHELEIANLTTMSKDEYVKKLQEYLAKVADFKQSDLAEYVGHRKLVIDLLAKALERGDDNKYQKEDFIHNFIMPMGTNSDESINSSNLWLLDDALAFHEYLSSDKTLKSSPITGSKETKEPDLMCLNIYDNPIAVSEGGSMPCGSLVVIELKRPMRNDMKPGDDEKDPIVQSLEYLDKIRAGGVTTTNGRPISNSANFPGFCYVLADLTSSMKKCCKIHNLTETSDGMGYFGYKETYKSYIEVISFERMLNLAKRRNRAFFDKLGLPSTQ